MSSLLKKLNYKAQDRILVLGQPPEFEIFLSEFQAVMKLDREPSSKIKYDFIIAFSIMKKDLENILKKTSKAASDECLYWFAYPKKTSKKYNSDITRDSGWQKLGDLGYEAVNLLVSKIKSQDKAGIFSSFLVCEGRSPLAASKLAKPPVGISIPRKTWVKSNYEAARLSSYAVRMTAIDEDWSAMRFKKADKIKTMKRNEKLAMSSAGKKKIKLG